MKRREFITLLGTLTGGVLAAPLAAGAQQARSSRHIGVLLNAFSPEEQAPQAFRQGLRDAGYAEGGDVVIEWRAAYGDRSRLPELAADLVQRKVDVIVVDSTPCAQAAKNATSTIPIVLALVVDPVGSGLVTSLQRPGGNVTGLSMMTPELAGKRLQLLKEAIPSLARVGVPSESRLCVPHAGRQRSQGSSALAIDRAELCGRANTRGVRPGVVGFQPSTRPSSVRD